MKRLKVLAEVLVVAAAIFIVFAVVTTDDNAFDPTSDIDTMRERLRERVGLAASDTRRAAKKTEKAVKKQERKLKHKANTVKRKVHTKYKSGMNRVQ